HSAAATRRATRMVARRRSRRRSAGLVGSASASVSRSIASRTGVSQWMWIAPSPGSQIRTAMLTAVNAATVAIGGQRDSPIPVACSVAVMTLRLPAKRHLEWASTILLALATVATAWAAYQSRQWTGEQSTGYSQATAARISENRAAALANRQVQIDVATFIQW